MLIAILGVIVVTSFLVPGGGGAKEPAASPPGDTPYNVVVAVLDDLDDIDCADMDQFLPRSSRWLVDQGRCFEDATAASPVCCPARAMLATGQLPHNNGVRRQIDGHRLRAEDTVQADLSAAGVDTYGLGKFLNGLPSEEVQTGRFDTGFARTEFWDTTHYRNFKLIDRNGRRRSPGPNAHVTEVTGRYLRDYLSERAADDRPFYAYAGFFGPHNQWRGKDHRGSRLPVPTAANADRPVPPFRLHTEGDARDKLFPFRKLAGDSSQLKTLYEARVRATYDIDDQLAEMFEQMEGNGLIDNTAVIFVSDNGFALGENNWEGKAVPYPASVDVPMLMYLPPGLGERGIDQRPVDLLDVAPTIYDIVDVKPDHLLDGHSLLGRHERKARFLEFTNEASELVLKESGRAPVYVPSWAMLRVETRALIAFDLGQGEVRWEYYADPGMERNLMWDRVPRSDRPAPAVVAQMTADLERLRTCAGTTESGAANPCP
ncbi:sulfatase-like hydrolase/transferase [Nocardioides speluncae]|uniref:sulfatase-like hydrolase/transferase n=1 Tax=Nocardioides speluncae TaxID=2670337 RepID=UPI0013796C45|nr:sulfatase-like hydrolase/transferase [Nocardioides speluncae]